MIDIVTEKDIQEMLESRRKKYVLGEEEFWVLSKLNHLFFFDSAKDVSLKKTNNIWVPFSSPEIIKSYGLRYQTTTDFFLYSVLFAKQIESLYKLFISDPHCMFFIYNQEVSLLEQELTYRGLR